MNRIEKKFKELKAINRSALIVYLTAGDPDLATTEKLIHILEKAGADIIELGVPFSDPMADGPTIQLASERALKNYFTLDDIFKMVKRVRKNSEIPMVLFSYYNPIFSYGERSAVKKAKEAGIDGFLIVDLPPEEGKNLKTLCSSSDLKVIFLCAPTSSEERIRIISKQSSGFIYYVSVTGVTGARKELPSDLREHIRKIKSISKLPLVVGFGISNPEQARVVAKVADGVVVGSALVERIAKFGFSKRLEREVEKFIKSLKQAMLRQGES